MVPAGNISTLLPCFVGSVFHQHVSPGWLHFFAKGFMQGRACKVLGGSFFCVLSTWELCVSCAVGPRLCLLLALPHWTLLCR